MFYSPLRYPGGKNKLSKLIGEICQENNIANHYIEPFVGGGSVALNLLLNNKIEKITINDLDRSIYAFWYSLLHHTDKLCELINQTPITIETWRKQKTIQLKKKSTNLLDLGFSTLFLNRTNFSGIINGGVLGGKEQSGRYKLDCRFNKSSLIKKIIAISKFKKKIAIYNLDALQLIDTIEKKPDSFFYFDPPYFEKGKSLYLNHYTGNDHQNLSCKIKSIKKSKWIVSYDNNSFIKNIYNWVPEGFTKEIILNHFANQIKKGKEILFFSKNLKLTI